MAAGILPREYQSWSEVQTQQVWPTPLAADANKADCTVPAIMRRVEKRQTLSLAMQVRMFPTQVASNTKAVALRTGGREPKSYLDSNNPTPGSLNPTWVEWLMGFPAEWTVLDASEMPLSRKSRK